LDEGEGEGEGAGEGAGDGEGEGVGEGEGEGEGVGEGEGEGGVTMVELQTELTAAAGTLDLMARAALKAGTVVASRQLSSLETWDARPAAETFFKASIGAGIGVAVLQLVTLVPLQLVCILRSAI